MENINNIVVGIPRNTPPHKNTNDNNKEKMTVFLLAIIFIIVFIGTSWDLYGKNLLKRPANITDIPDQNYNPRPASTTTNSRITSTIGTQSSNNTNPTNSNTGSFILYSEAGKDGDAMSAEYTCDGAGISPSISWSNAPVGTKEFALTMSTLPGDGTTKWSWVMYGIPPNTTGWAKNTSSVGKMGVGSHGSTMQYEPPCSQGPGSKIYTITLYALSGSPKLPSIASQVTGDVLSQAITSITISSAKLNLSYARK